MNRFGHETLDASIAEMSPTATGGSIDVAVDATKVEKLLARDKDPMFVTIQVAREGISKNGRIYTAETMQEIADQINTHQPDGYKGHLTEQERASKNPDAETIWLGAKVAKDKDGKVSVYAKGYVMPSAKKRREYLQTAFDLGKNVAVSIFGGAEKAVYNAKEKAYDIFGLQVQSVDWARSRSEGIPNDGTLILTSEMHNPKEGKDMTLAEALKTAKLSDLREHAPELVTEMETEARKDYAPVSEMTSIQEMVGAKDSTEAETKISEMKTKLSGFELNSEIDSRVAAKSARPVIKKMALAEMTETETVQETVERVLQTDQAKAIIKEMTGTPKVNPTNDDRSQPTARSFTKARS
jgi:hypothetical protein